MKASTDYYVYVYIDPRNLEEFYYGKGRGTRKTSHLSDDQDTEKAKRIKDILRSGLKPIIKVIAKDLSEHDALLVEKTLIWKLGRQLTNVSSGYFAEQFRPHNTMHLVLQGFDSQNGIYFFNVGEPHRGRSWAKCSKYGFISAGGRENKMWREAVQGLVVGDVVVAYLKGKGFVGIGVVTKPAVIVSAFRTRQGKRLDELNWKEKGILEYDDDPETAEYVAQIDWVKTCAPSEAKFRRNRGLFTPRIARASLQNHPETLNFISKAFGVDVRGLLKQAEFG